MLRKLANREAYRSRDTSRLRNPAAEVLAAATAAIEDPTGAAVAIVIAAEAVAETADDEAFHLNRHEDHEFPMAIRGSSVYPRP